MKKLEKGNIDISRLNVLPEKHEYATARYFADRGYDVIFIRPSSIRGQNSADFEMGGRIWETKGPVKYSKASFEDNTRKAVRQSEHIIFDLRRLSEKDESSYMKKLEGRGKARKIKTLLIIARDGRLLTLKGEFSII